MWNETPLCSSRFLVCAKGAEHASAHRRTHIRGHMHMHSARAHARITIGGAHQLRDLEPPRLARALHGVGGPHRLAEEAVLGHRGPDDRCDDRPARNAGAHCNAHVARLDHLERFEGEERDARCALGAAAALRRAADNHVRVADGVRLEDVVALGEFVELCVDLVARMPESSEPRMAPCKRCRRAWGRADAERSDTAIEGGRGRDRRNGSEDSGGRQGERGRGRSGKFEGRS
eukprot:2700747-Rhodomonas_salina.2